jgi:hypothetical protein
VAGSVPLDPFQDPTADLELRRPGQGAREEALRLRKQQPLLSALALLFRIHTDERAWRVGAVGEERVGARLDRLPKPDWLVLHDLMTGPGNANLDHLVIGPPGVFAIDTKHHPRGRVRVGRQIVFVNGQATNYRASIVRQAKHVKRSILKHTQVQFGVTPVLAVLCKDLRTRPRLPDTVVVDGLFIRTWLLRQTAALAGSDLWRLRHDVAAWAKTLEGRPPPRQGLPVV